MITVTKEIRPEEVRQAKRHVLFVEGKDESAIDSTILKNLLRFDQSTIRVEPMGPSYYIKSVAEALYKHHPNYYFLIDRDHYNDDFVENCWNNFPDPSTYNLLVWFRREIENYFLIPEYLVKSPYLTVSADELRQQLLKSCRDRLYLETVNQVLVYVREELKNKWIELFDKPQEFRTKDEAIAKLLNISELTRQLDKTSELVNTSKLRELFNEALDKFTGRQENLDFGCGQWLQLMRGKKVLPSIIHHCFKVTDARGKLLQGAVKLTEVLKDLVRQPLAQQPEDFQRLHHLLWRKIKQPA